MVVARELALRHWRVVLLERSGRLGGKAGADVSKLDRPWAIGTAGTMTISVSRVALGSLDQAEQAVDCPR